jgi:hypothetical protein
MRRHDPKPVIGFDVVSRNPITESRRASDGRRIAALAR